MNFLLKTLLIFTINTLCFSTFVFGRIDVSQYEIDTAKINKQIKLASNLIHTNPDSSRLYIDTLMDLSKRVEYTQGLFKGNNFLGIYFWMYANYDSALYYYREALRLSELTDSKRNKGIILGNIGLLYGNIFNTDSAIAYLEKTVDYSLKNNAVDLANKANFDLGRMYLNQGVFSEAIQHLMQVKDSLVSHPDSNLAVLVNSIFGSLYYHLDDFDKSLFYYNKAITLDENNVDVDILPNINVFKGQLYFDLKKDADSAEYFYKHALEIVNDYNREFIKINVYIGLGNIFYTNQNYDSSAYYYFKVLESPVLHGNLGFKAAALVNLGGYYLNIGEYGKSKSYLMEGLKLADTLGILNYQQVAYENLIDLSHKTNNYKNGVDYYSKLTAIKDSIQKDEAKEVLEKIKLNKYLADQKYNIKYLEKENELKSRLLHNKNILLILSLIAGIILFIYLINIFITRNKIKKLAAELSRRNIDLKNVNEETNLLNEELNAVNEELNDVNEELRVQQEKLIEANQAKDKFFAILAHDLKSPFHSLIGFMSLLKDDWNVLDEEEKKTIVEKLYTNSTVTLELLEGLLDWGKTQRGQIIANKTVFNVKSKIEEILKVTNSHIKKKGLNFILDISDSLVIDNDPQLFQHIMMNLINNAIKFTARGGEISVFAVKEKELNRICVKDSGIGFPENMREKAFSLEFDFNRNGTEDEKSTGMGLILCSEYARIMGANLTLESKENEGSTFCLIL